MSQPPAHASDWRDDEPPVDALVWRRVGDGPAEPVETCRGSDGRLAYLPIGYEADQPWTTHTTRGRVRWLPLPRPA